MNIGNHLLKSVQKKVILNSLVSRRYAFKSDLKIKWVRPEKILSYKPEKSGDLEQFPKLDKAQPQLKFRNCKELQDADPIVAKLFSLDFAPRSKAVGVYIDEITNRVQRHENDKGSIEHRIAEWTGAIRGMQEVMEAYPRNKIVKVRLKELIDKRKKHLKYLRRWDYKKFEWILENLNIVYKPPPQNFLPITRKESLRKLTNKYCDKLVESKLNEYKAILQAEQPAFLEEKMRTLEFIRNEQQECGVEVTVTQEEIDGVRKKLEELRNQRKALIKED